MPCPEPYLKNPLPPAPLTILLPPPPFSALCHLSLSDAGSPLPLPLGSWGACTRHSSHPGGTRGAGHLYQAFCKQLIRWLCFTHGSVVGAHSKTTLGSDSSSTATCNPWSNCLQRDAWHRCPSHPRWHDPCRSHDGAVSPMACLSVLEETLAMGQKGTRSDYREIAHQAYTRVRLSEGIL